MMHARTAAFFSRYAPPLIGGVFILAVWEYVPAYFNVSRLLLPPPSSIVHSLWLIYQRGLLVDNFAVTLIEALSGFALGSIAAIFFAFLVTRSLLLERMLMPYLVGLQALPKVALAPLIVVWIGIGIESKILIAAVISFFPVLINAIVGFSTVEEEKIDLMRSLVASRWQQFRIVIFPNSLPFIFAGLNVAIVLSITGALVGEFIGADRGLGNLLLQLNYNMDISGMFAVLAVLAMLGIMLYALVRFLHVRLVFWAKPDNFRNNTN
jgi:NitT/TauT family transport system permease protein